MAYPTMKYSKDASRIVNSPEEEKALKGQWYDSPADVPEAKKDANGFVAAAPHDVTPVSATIDLPPVKEGNTNHDRIIWQAQHVGIKIDKRWSDETLLRKIQELQPLSRDGIEEANKAVPDEQELDYDPTLSATEREVDKKVKDKLEAEKKPKVEVPKVEVPKVEVPKPVAAKQPEAVKP